MEKIRPTMMDRAISAVSPKWGAKRLSNKAAYATISAAVTDPGAEIGRRSGYRAGRSDRRQTRGWFARPQSANTDAIARRQDLIGRSRDAAMNLPPATAAIERNVSFAIGTGLMALPDLDGELLGLSPEEVAQWKTRIRRDYDNYMSSKDPDAERATTGYGLQETVLRGQLESGDVLGLRCWPDDQIGRVHMTAWKLFEADRIVSPSGHTEGKRLDGGNICVGGVEQDTWGAAVAYHVLVQAPGPTNTGRRPNDTARFAAWGEQTKIPSAVLVFDKRRPEQARGIPLLAPVLELVKMFSDATDAAALSLVLQSMLAVIYKSPGATALPEPEYGAGEIVQAEYEPETVGRPTNSDVKMEPGMVLELDSDSEVELKSPGKDNPVYEKFFEAILTQVGAAIGTPFGVLMARFNNSYTASKGELELFYKEVQRRVSRFTADWCVPGYQCWMYERVARGFYDLPGFLDDLNIREAWCSVRWAGDGKISLDPLRERKAYEIDEAHGWQTGEQIAAQINGGDFDANIERRGDEVKRFKAAGLEMPKPAGSPGAATSPAAASDRAETGDKKDDDDE